MPLRPKSLALLRLLVENPGRVVDRDAIMAAVWPDVVVGDELITQCVRDIRKALGDEAQQLLKTVPKRGYLLAAEVTPAESTAPAPRVERRLAAILAADIVGYSRLIEQDEAGTLAAIKGLREQAIDPLLAEHKGRIVKLMGDGAIVEFASVVDAVACAVAIQKAVADRQAKTPADRRIVFRIGVNLGDVVVEGDDLLGDGVNVAARLEQLCEPGGVLVSGTAFDHLQGRLGHAAGVHRRAAGQEHRPAGAGVPGAAGWQPARLAPRSHSRHGRRRCWPRRLALFAGSGAAASGGCWPASRPPASPRSPSCRSTTLAATRRPAGSPTAITEDIITDLARFRDLDVIARNSTRAYKGMPGDVQVGRELDVRYVLEGSIQRERERVRVTAQLIDCPIRARTSGPSAGTAQQRTCSRCRPRSRSGPSTTSIAWPGSSSRGKQAASARLTWKRTSLSRFPRICAPARWARSGRHWPTPTRQSPRTPRSLVPMSPKRGRSGDGPLRRQLPRDHGADGEARAHRDGTRSLRRVRLHHARLRHQQ